MIGFDPESQVSFCLKSDESNPIESRPTFISRLLSVRQAQKVFSLAEQATAAKTNEEANGLLNDAIMVGMTGWRNVTDEEGKPLDFARESLDAAFTLSSKWDFVYAYPGRLSIGEADLKK